MAADHFCLRWNNHQSTLVSVFDDLFESETLVDCTLAADGKYLKAHKVVLSACSPYLGMILSQHYDQHPIIILKDVKYEEMKAMLDYMYRGEVNISQELLATFLKAAESLQIKGLTDNSRLNEEATKKQLQVDRPPSSDESTTSAPPADDIPSREGSCSPTPKKRKQDVMCKNNLESNKSAVKNEIASDLSVCNSVSSVFKLTGSDVAKNSVYVKHEPVEELAFDGVKGLEDSKKGISRPGPSNGSNSSIPGSPWPLSVDSSAGDEMQLGSEQDGPKVTNVMSLHQSEDTYVSWLDCLTTIDATEEMIAKYGGSVKSGWQEGQRYICLVCASGSLLISRCSFGTWKSQIKRKMKNRVRKRICPECFHVQH